MREFFVSQRGLLDRRVSSRRLAPRRDAADLRQSPEHVLAAVGQARAARPAKAGASSSSPRTSRRTRGWCGRSTQGGYGARRDVERRLSPQRDGGAHRPRRGLLQRHARGRRRSSSRREVRLSLSGPVLPLAAATSAARPPCDLPPPRFVTFLQNHDQVANSARGLRGSRADEPGALARDDGAAAARCRARRCCFRARSSPRRRPFLYLRGSRGRSARRPVANGPRREFLEQFPEHARPDDAGRCSPIRRRSTTFKRCKLDFGERERTREAYALHTDLLRLRREEPAFARAAMRPARRRRAVRSRVRAALLHAEHRDDRLLVVNLGRRSDPRSIAEPLLAPPADSDWRCAWSSEDPPYGGGGTPDIVPDGMVLPGESRDGAAPDPGGCAVLDQGAAATNCCDEAEPFGSTCAGRRRRRRCTSCSTREWLVTNGLGGYASGTVAGRDHAPLSRAARSPRCRRRSAAW